MLLLPPLLLLNVTLNVLIMMFNELGLAAKMFHHRKVGEVQLIMTASNGKSLLSRMVGIDSPVGSRDLMSRAKLPA